MGSQNVALRGTGTWILGWISVRTILSGIHLNGGTKSHPIEHSRMGGSILDDHCVGRGLLDDSEPCPPFDRWANLEGERNYSI